MLVSICDVLVIYLPGISGYLYAVGICERLEYLMVVLLDGLFN